LSPAFFWPRFLSDVTDATDGSDASDSQEGMKRVLYALGGVAEYWVVDLQGWQILVFRNSDQGEWQDKLTFVPGQTLSSLAFPDVETAASDVLDP